MGSNPTFRTKISQREILSRANAVSRGTGLSDLPTGWCCYLLLCAHSSYYCGIASDLKTRLQHPSTGKGGKHSLVVRPHYLVWCESHSNRRLAAARERQVKNWSHAKKKHLTEGRRPYDTMGKPVWVPLGSVLRSQHPRSG